MAPAVGKPLLKFTGVSLRQPLKTAALGDGQHLGRRHLNVSGAVSFGGQRGFPSGDVFGQRHGRRPLGRIHIGGDITLAP